jgi:hypothetical protein
MQVQEQTIEKFLDEEDVGKQQLGVNLTVKAEFDPYGHTEIGALQGMMGLNQVLGTVPSELVYTENRSIGYKIL